MKKLNFRIKTLINNEIKVNDTVRLIDGSALSLVHNNEVDWYVIVSSYPRITGSNENLKDIDCIVLETGITDIISNPDSIVSNCYLCDIKVKVGDAQFYTCSKLVEKIN